MADSLISPVTGNELIGNGTFGFKDSVTGEFFMSDEILGSAVEGNFGLEDIASMGLRSGGNMVVKWTAGKIGLKLGKMHKKKSACATCHKSDSSEETPANASDAFEFMGP